MTVRSPSGQYHRAKFSSEKAPPVAALVLTLAEGEA